MSGLFSFVMEKKKKTEIDKAAERFRLFDTLETIVNKSQKTLHSWDQQKKQHLNPSRIVYGLK